MEQMKAYLIFAASGPVLVLTTLDFEKHPESLKQLATKTSKKFIAHELPLDAVKSNYSAHFEHVLNQTATNGDIKILDSDGKQIFTNVKFKDLGEPIYYDP